MVEPRNGRIFVLDALKAFAAIMVIVTHFQWESRENFLFYYVINMAVPIFMIISGYNFSASYERMKSKNMRAWIEKFIKQIICFTVPYMMVWTVRMIEKIVWLKKAYTPLEIVEQFIIGGDGPGSYYYPLLIQMIFVVPIINYIVKNVGGGVGYIFMGNILLEILVVRTPISSQIYRLLLIRYLFILALGCWMFYNRYEKGYKLIIENIIFVIIGSFYLWLLITRKYTPKLFFDWKNRSLFCGLYIYPIICYIFRRCNEYKLKSKIGKLISDIGKASYCIFLMQMLYYVSGADTVVGTFLDTAPHLIFNIFICLICGLGLDLLCKRFINIIYELLRGLENCIMKK